MQISLASFAAVCLSACSPSIIPGDSNDHTPFSEVHRDEVIHFSGTEPFWGGQIRGGKMSYKTPDDPAGAVIPVSRFAGRGGLSFSGELKGRNLTLAITPGRCADGMADRTYPFVVTLRLDDDVKQGCAWTQRKPWANGG